MSDGDDLFGWHTRARRDDPWTSKAAAKRIVPTLNDKQRKVWLIHREHKRGLTNWELEILAGSHNSTWRTRVSELVTLGVLVDSGRAKRIADSDDPRSDRIIWICQEYADPELFEPMRIVEPPPTNAHLDAEGRVIHNECAVCGKDAPFGTGVFLRKGNLGIWYCREHWPNDPDAANRVR